MWGVVVGRRWNACPTHFQWLWRMPDCDGGIQGKHQKDAVPLCSSPSLFCAHQGEKKPLATSRAACVGSWFLHNFEGDWRCSASCQRAHQEDESQKKPKPTSPLLLVCKPVHLLPLRESSRKAGIPLGNTGDRLKSRQKKSYFTVSLPWTRKGSWHQQTNQRWKLMRSSFPFSSIILLIFSNWLGLDSSGKSINIKSFFAYPWSTPRAIWIPVGTS